MAKLTIFLLILLRFLHHSILPVISGSPPTATFSIADYGAKADGEMDSTKALLSAWSSACNSNTPATVSIPAGTFLVGQVSLNGPCQNNNITVQMNGSTLVAPSDYKTLGKEWIKFYRVDGIAIYGGTIDGRGASLWSCKNSSSSHSCPLGASSLVFANSKNIVLSGLTSVNCKLYHIVVHAHSQNVRVQDVKIIAPPDSPNTNGIHVQSSSPVTISGATIATGDDCISVGPGTANLSIENVTCGPGHGISIGSLGKNPREEGVQNVSVRTATFLGSDNGVRIKTWAKPSTSFVRDVRFEHIEMQNVKNPIIIDQFYCNRNKGCSKQRGSGVKISQVTFSDIHGTSATPVAVRLDCSPVSPCSGINLRDIDLSYRDHLAAQAFCSHADVTISGLVVPSGCL